jgi:hypothetical protein
MEHRITRPARGADEHDLREYMRDLARVLDNAGVDNGEQFVVSAPKRKVVDPYRYELAEYDEDQVGAVRSGASSTSSSAAVAVFPKSGSMRHRIVTLAVERGAAGITADEAAQAFGVSVLSTRPRIVELRAGGWLASTGDHRVSDNGNAQDVHRATAKAVTATCINKSMIKTSAAEAEQLRMTV